MRLDIPEQLKPFDEFLYRSKDKERPGCLLWRGKYNAYGLPFSGRWNLRRLSLDMIQAPVTIINTCGNYMCVAPEHLKAITRYKKKGGGAPC